MAPGGGQLSWPAGGSVTSGARAPVACSVHGSPGSPEGRECIVMGRRPSSSAAPTSSCSVTRPCSGRARGARRVSSSTASHPATSPACRARSRNAVPGRSTVPRTTWSASHGCVAVDRVPVKANSSLPASPTVAASSGCPPGERPSRPRSPLGRVASSGQNRVRWKG